MYSAALLAVVGILCSISSAQVVSSDERGLAALQAVTSSNLNFTNSIYKILSQTEGNVFFSPISIEVILALAYLGARGETASQMARGLHLPEDKDLIARGFNTVITSLKSDENFTLEIANKIFTDNTIPLKKEFQEIAQTSFLSDVEAVDFRTNPEAARVQINQWVEEKTNEKIKDLLPKGIVSSDTALFLVNALYFKGGWVQNFWLANTGPKPFYLTPSQTKDVVMMKERSRQFGFKVSEELDCKILEMPFKGEKVSMVVFLPNELDGLTNMEAKLADVDFKQLLSSLEKTLVEVTMPKFKIEQFTELNELLKKLGMVDMFENSANFSGLTESAVKVSKVVHKAFIKVDEKGAEAAAATGLGAIPFSLKRYGPEEHQVFKADHPFLFVLREKTTQTGLFVGRVSDPSRT